MPQTEVLGDLTFLKPSDPGPPMRVYYYALLCSTYYSIWCYVAICCYSINVFITDLLFCAMSTRPET